LQMKAVLVGARWELTGLQNHGQVVPWLEDHIPLLRPLQQREVVSRSLDNQAESLRDLVRGDQAFRNDVVHGLGDAQIRFPFPWICHVAQKVRARYLYLMYSRVGTFGLQAWVDRKHVRTECFP